MSTNSPPLFSPVGNTYGLSFSTVSSNIVMQNQSVTPNSSIEITNSSGNLVFVAFSSTLIGNINHPTPGSSGSAASYPVRTGETRWISPGLGTYTGNIVASAISIAGTGNIYITVGAE